MRSLLLSYILDPITLLALFSFPVLHSIWSTNMNGNEATMGDAGGPQDGWLQGTLPEGASIELGYHMGTTWSVA